MQATTATGSLIQTILGLPIFRSEWVLYLLLALSIASIGVILERWVFYRRRALLPGSGAPVPARRRSVTVP